MITVLVPPGRACADQALELEGDETHHLRVRRVPAGADLRLRDGQGLIAHGHLRWEGKRALVDVLEVAEAARPPALTIAVGAGDRDRFGWLVEKAAEVGITDLLPMMTALTPGVATRIRSSQLGGLRRRAREAVKQSGAAWAPVIHEPLSLVQLPPASPGRRWLADPAGDLPPESLDADPVTIVVGPEGGLTPAERKVLLEAGYAPIRLGAHVLRFETAALVAAAAVGFARQRGMEEATDARHTEERGADD